MGRPGKVVIAAATFASALLLFQVQPIVGKGLLPRFGGSASVWTTCMLFFQVLLLLGYAYAHVSSRLPCRWQATLHCGLLALAAVPLQLSPADSVGSLSTTSPTGAILGALLTGIGPAFLLLSASAPLLQRWYAWATDESPYRLYALSNAGSLVGLVAYPFLLEPALAQQSQERLWTSAYFALLALFGLVTIALPRTKSHEGQAPSPPTGGQASPGTWDMLRWFVLAAAPSALLLAVTNKLSVEITPFPLLWILPLSLYLITFIISFDHQVWYRPREIRWLAILSLVAVGLVLRATSPPIAWTAGSLLAGMTFCCLLCHGELARRKPPPDYLTRYYLAVAAGGACGGFCVAVAAPIACSGYHEFPLAFVLCFVLGLLPPSGGKHLPRAHWQRHAASAVAASVAVGVWLSPELVGALHAALRTILGPADKGADLLPILPAAAFLGGLLWAWGCDEEGSASKCVARTGVRVAAMPLFVAVALGLVLIGFWWAWAALPSGGSLADSSPRLWLNPLVAWALFAAALSAMDRWHQGNSIEHQGAVNGHVIHSRQSISAQAALCCAAAALAVLLAWKSSLEHLLAPDSWLRLACVAMALFAPLFVRLPLTIARPRVLCLVILVGSVLPGLMDVINHQMWQGSFGSLLVTTIVIYACMTLAVTGGNGPKLRWTLWAGLCVGIAMGAATIAAWPELLLRGVSTLVALVAVGIYLSSGSGGLGNAYLWKMTATALALCAVGVACGLAPPAVDRAARIAVSRNFYGVKEVVELGAHRPTRSLLHGSTTHGMQFQDESGRPEPTTYYARESGIGQLLQSLPPGSKRVGVIGLGVGTLAAYARDGDFYRFFEIDPDVVAFAKEYFDFLGACPIKPDVVVADGRLALARETDDPPYDVLVVDAFAGDAIPTHLLTAEAFALYLRRISTGSMLALHISNNHVDLSPVINAHAQDLGLRLVYVYSAQPHRGEKSLWAILSRTEVPVRQAVAGAPISSRAIHWTDRQHSIVPLIRWRRTGAAVPNP